ncbi:MAG: helix-turn-helix transcriptional regulator [Spirochaetales bacterium]|nr:helix-turn-helix transcriptional regulator [Spirochaetales bacterium]
MEHIKLLLTFFNLLLGCVIITFLLFKQRMYGGVKFFTFLAVYALIYNLLLIIAFIGKYIKINLPPLLFFTGHPVYIQISQISFVILMSLMAFLQFKILYSFRQANPESKIRRIMLIFIILFSLVLIAGSICLYIGISFSYFLLESMGDLMFICDFLILIRICYESFKTSDERKRGLMRPYAFLFLSRYPLIVLMLIIHENIRFFSTIAVLFYMNLIPLIWTMMFFRRGNLVEKGGIEITKEKNLTPRELEIIQFILAGKSNSEIEEILFLSPHTVKNHIYNIFRKLHVKNRYELISLYR